jgi:hypothetical protein
MAVPSFFIRKNLVFRARPEIFGYAEKVTQKFKKLNIQHPTLNIEHRTVVRLRRSIIKKPVFGSHQDRQAL